MGNEVIVNIRPYFKKTLENFDPTRKADLVWFFNKKKRLSSDELHVLTTDFHMHLVGRIIPIFNPYIMQYWRWLGNIISIWYWLDSKEFKRDFINFFSKKWAINININQIINTSLWVAQKFNIKKWDYEKTWSSFFFLDVYLKWNYDFNITNDGTFNIAYQSPRNNVLNWILNIKPLISHDEMLRHLRIINLSKKIVSFTELNIRNFSDIIEIDLTWLEIDTLDLSNLNNSGIDFKITDCHITNFVARNSDFGTMKLNGVVIENLAIENVTMNDTIFNGVSFQSYKLWTKIREIEIPTKKMKDNYRQLKHVMDKNGNHTEANKFYTKEMQEYWKDLNVIEWFWRNLFIILSQAGFWKNNSNLGEKIVLVLWDNISEHGTNLIRAIFLFIILGVLAAFISSWYITIWVYLLENSCDTVKMFPWESICTIEKALFVTWILFFLLAIIMFFSLITFFYLFSKVFHFIKKNIFRRFSKKKQIKIKSIFNKLIKHPKNFLSKLDILFFILLIFILSFWPDSKYTISGINYIYDPLQHFLTLLYPLHWFKSDDFISFSNLEIMSFIFYKIFHWIILWNIIVTARRITRR